MLAVATFLDVIILYRATNAVSASRQLAERFSNGDFNEVAIEVENRYTFQIDVVVQDGVPDQFQWREQNHNITLPARSKISIRYQLRPVTRGEYHFGQIALFVTSPLGLICRRSYSGQKQMVPVYPSFRQMQKYELMAISNRLTDVGLKKIRRIGHTMEFDHIREYVVGDDYRTLNWKATARKSQFMVNQYQDERAQRVYSLIDMGRVMQMPFEEMTLLDYAINAALVIANIALRRGDRAGLITFSQKIEALLAADQKRAQLSRIMEVLYNQQTGFLESNYEMLTATVRRKVKQRSLLLLFTNFESLSSMHRQLGYLRIMAASHLVVVVFFENTELATITDEPAKNTEQIYIKTIAEKFAYEKRLIVAELEQHGIHSVLTKPKDLSVQTINKYLQLKARGLI